VRAAEEGMGDSEPDPRPAGVDDDIVGYQVAVALLDPDTVVAPELLAAYLVQVDTEARKAVIS